MMIHIVVREGNGRLNLAADICISCKGEKISNYELKVDWSILFLARAKKHVSFVTSSVRFAFVHRQ